jgi:rhodanese-related sulfurtransferase
MFKFLKSLFGPKADFKELVSKGAVIIDVRTAEEFKAGHIKDSLNIPVDKIAGQAEKLKKQGKVVITCCRSGARSGMAQEILNQKGVEAYNGGPWNELRKVLSES